MDEIDELLNELDETAARFNEPPALCGLPRRGVAWREMRRVVVEWQERQKRNTAMHIRDTDHGQPRREPDGDCLFA